MAVKKPKALTDKGKRDHHKKKPGITADLPPDIPKPPNYLSADAQTEWFFIVECFKDTELFSKIDSSLLESYCRYMALWRQAVSDVETEGLVIWNGGKKVVNPKLTAANSMMMHLNKHMAAMGLTPSARSAIRLANPKEEIPEELKDFLK